MYHGCLVVLQACKAMVLQRWALEFRCLPALLLTNFNKAIGTLFLGHAHLKQRTKPKPIKEQYLYDLVRSCMYVCIYVNMILHIYIHTYTSNQPVFVRFRELSRLVFGGLAIAVDCYQSQELKHFNDPAAELQVRSAHRVFCMVALVALAMS